MPHKTTDKSIPPKSDEFELSLFGPGVGECVVVHLGQGEWMTIDSCMNVESSRPVALDYLDLLGVDVTKNLKLIVVSHWHDDHIRGASRLMRAAYSAEFVCSAALMKKEFCTLVASDDRSKLIEHSSGVSEFRDILQVLQDRRSGSYAPSPHQFASEDKVLFRKNSPIRIEVHALSPSAQTITDSHIEIAKMIPTVGSPAVRVPRPSPNKFSVAIAVNTEEFSVLLGGDLENNVDATRGWKAIIDSTRRISLQSLAYKVSHHGSANGDHSEIWTHLLRPKPIAMLTPYAAGRAPLPTEGDIKRLKRVAKSLICTTSLKFAPPRRRSVDATINRVAKRRRALCRVPGHIRLRLPFKGGPTALDFYDGAIQL